MSSRRWFWPALLLVLVVVFFALNRGIYVGSKIETAQLSDVYPVPFYKKHCRYLFLNGIKQVFTSAESTREDAERIACATLKPEPVIHRRRKPVVAPSDSQ